jgi:hypothetical protein
MHWHLSHQADPRAILLADRHYSRKTTGSDRFMPPGRQFVLMTDDGRAVWGVVWNRPEYVFHAWKHAWLNTLFRNESAHLSSDLIVAAVAATRWYWPDVPALGIVTFVDPRKVRSANPGYCYRMAGWTRLRERTKGGLVVYQLLPGDMPAPMPCLGAQLPLFA